MGAARRAAYLTLEAPRVGQASHVHVTEIIAGLERRGWSVKLYQPSYTNTAAKPGTVGRLWQYAVVQARLWAGRRPGEVIYVRAHFMAFPTALVARALRIPIFHEVNGPYADIFVTYPWLGRFRKPLEVLQRLQYRWATRLLPVTADLGRWLADEAGHDRITVISNGANTAIFNAEAPRPADAPEAPYAVFFGGLAHWHGVDTMLTAISDPVWPDGVRLVIIGAGSEAPKVQKAADEDDRIVYLGYRPYQEVAGWVAGAICGLVPISNPDGRANTGMLPLKLFETLACGVPAIVTDFPGQADIVREGECGLVVPADDGRALAGAVAALAADRASAVAMGQRGAALVKAEHSWDSRAGAVDRLLGEVF